MRLLTHTVTPQEAGLPVRTLLRRQLRISGSFLAKLKWRPGAITLNGIPVIVSTRTEAGDVLAADVSDLPGENPHIRPVAYPLDILWEDEDLLLLNKPAGIAIHPSALTEETVTVAGAVCHYLRTGSFHCVNRLDRGTTGVMAVAKTGYIHRLCMESLHTDSFLREYRGICLGTPQPSSGSIDLPISRDPGSLLRRTVLLVEISVQGGEELAKKTFNPRLGIVGGISILGTTGIVEPMSSQALLDTIYVELKQKREEGNRFAAISPGNYGLQYMKRAYGFDLDRSVKCSNFIGKTMDMAVELGFEAVLLTGHIGKLVKLSGGIMDTHSREADARMELLMAAAYRAGCAPDTLGKILDCLVTEEALAYIAKDGCLSATMELLMKKILFYLKKRVKEKLRVECILYANGYGELARSDGAVELLERIRGEEEHLQ